MSAVGLEMRLTRLLPPLLLGLVALFSVATRALAADPEGTVYIYLVDRSGLPVPGATVEVDGTTVCTTDREGTCVVKIPGGKARLTIAKSGFPTQRLEVEVVPGRSIELISRYTKDGGELLDLETPSGIAAGTSTITETGRLVGRVVGQDGEPVEDARVFVRGFPIDARTDESGQFVLEEAPATKLDLTLIHPDHGTTNRDGVMVKPNETTTIDVTLEPATGFSKEYIITIPKLEGGAVAVLEERRESSSVADLLGADQISKSGDSDAAAALQRVTGVTLIEGRYVYVRGLGERYSTTLLDGSILPSPDPEKRVVPLDLFPSSILGSIVVQKTYSPDLPGEFGGGTVNLRTREVPEDFMLQVSVSGGYLTGTTFTEALGYEGTSTDILGFGAGGRAIADPLQEVLDEGRLTDSPPEDVILTLNEDFGLRPEEVPPAFGFGLDVGGTTDLFGKPFGALFGMTYGNSYFAKESVFNTWGSRDTDEGRLLDPNLQVRLLDLIQDINLGALLILSYDLAEDDRLRFTGSINRIAEKSARLQYGFTNENETRLNRLRWVEQMLVTNQIRGEHDDVWGSGVRLDWRYMFSFATRDEPDRREVAYLFERNSADAVLTRGFYRLDSQDILNQRFYSNLFDLTNDLGLDVTKVVNLFGDVESKLKAGLAGLVKSRTRELRRLAYQESGSVPRLPPSEIFNENTIDEVFLLSETTLEDDNYDAQQTVAGAYAMGDIGFSEAFRLLLGARMEYSTQTVKTFLPGADRSGEPNKEANLDALDVLPAATLTWRFVEDMQLRVAASRTLSRPNFRELSPAVFRDLGGTVEYQGNENLERTNITNFDLRYEWYPSAGESLSASFFFKYFEQPVEQTALSGAVTRFQFQNIDEAINMGGELETRLEFGWIDAFFADAYFAGNLTLVYSQVNIEDPGTLTSTERPLAQQSPWVLNLQLGYDNPDAGINLSFLYNVFGPRIWAVGTQNAPDIYEQPFDQLDFVFGYSFLERFKLQFKAQNILDSIRRATQLSEAEDRERIVFRYRRGVKLGLGLSVDLD